MIGEVWREVPSLPAILASSEGRIMVKPYRGEMPNGGLRPYGGHPHFGVWSKQDERFIIVYKGKCYKVHQLVCEAFHGERPDLPEIEGGRVVVLHIDENSANNRADNLKWGTQKENLNAPGFKEYRRTGDHAKAQVFRHDLAAE